MEFPPTFIPTRYPAVRLLLGAVLGIIVYLAISWNTVGFAAGIILSVMTAGYVFVKKNYSASFWLCAVILGCWIGFHATVIKVPPRSIGEIPATIDGEISSILRRDSVSVRCIIDGKVDAQALPPIEPCRVILSVRNTTFREHFLETGARIYAVVSLRLPQKPSLPAEFDEWQYCASNEVQFLARAEASKVALLERSSGFRWFIHSSAGAIDRIIRSLYPREAGAIVSALVLGDKTQLNQETRSVFSLSGTAHVLAVSGFHVGIIASGVFVMLGFIRNRWAKFFIFTIVLGLFVIMSGLQPSAIRAGMMAELAMITLLLERRIVAVNIVALALVLVMVYSPHVIYSSGFQMSAASIIGITLLFQPFQRGLSIVISPATWFGEIIIASLAVTFAASVTVSPLVAYYFSIYSIISPLANFVVIPLISIAMIWVFFSVIFAAVNWGIATTFAAAATICIRTAESVNTWFVGLPFAAVQSSQSATIIAVLSSIVIVYVLYSRSKRQTLFRLSVSVVVMVASIMIIQPNINLHTTFSGGESKRLLAPRVNVVATIIPLKQGVTAVLITDRKAHQYPLGDASLERYLMGLRDSLIIGTRGNSSQWIAAQVRDSCPKTRIFTYPLSLQNTIATQAVY
jgi:ComEC/Rec2-related protein